MSTDIKQIPVLKATDRSEVGSRKVNDQRAQGKVPAQLYGHKKDNQLIWLDGHELELCLRSNPTLVNIEVAGAAQPALIKELQRGTFGAEIQHLDLQRVSMDEPVEVGVPVEYFGTPQGAEQGSRLEVMRTAVRIRVRADSIPASVRVNVGDIEVGSRFTFGMVQLPEGAKMLGKEHTTLCLVSQSKKAAAAAAPAPAAGKSAPAAKAPAAKAPAAKK
jgi:large subunit ribosomal protein L25